MKYKALKTYLNLLTEEQLEMDVTVELGAEEECHPAELRICGIDHEVLDNNHPVIYVK